MDECYGKVEVGVVVGDLVFFRFLVALFIFGFFYVRELGRVLGFRGRVFIFSFVRFILEIGDFDFSLGGGFYFN